MYIGSAKEQPLSFNNVKHFRAILIFKNSTKVNWTTIMLPIPFVKHFLNPLKTLRFFILVFKY